MAPSKILINALNLSAFGLGIDLRINFVFGYFAENEKNNLLSVDSSWARSGK